MQEAGLSFYSYVILSRVLRGRQWYIFAVLFWTTILAIAVVRIMIAVMRVRLILDGNDGLQTTINHLHIGYFVLIAVVECVSSYFLLTIFASAKTTSLRAAIKTGLFQYLMRSTEVRLALLAILGTMRAITYSFQATAQSATNVASQLDRFAYTMECLFPVIMLSVLPCPTPPALPSPRLTTRSIDILASKLVFTNQVYDSSSRSRGKSYPRQFVTSRKGEGTYTASRGEHVIEVQGGGGGHGGGGAGGGGRSGHRTSSQERIIEAGSSSRTTPSDIDLEVMDPKRVGISKTVEFEVYESENRMR